MSDTRKAQAGQCRQVSIRPVPRESVVIGKTQQVHFAHPFLGSRRLDYHGPFDDTAVFGHDPRRFRFVLPQTVIGSGVDGQDGDDEEPVGLVGMGQVRVSSSSRR